MYRDSILMFYPEECFNVVNDCAVLAVQHSFQPSCFDNFTYTWRFMNSTVQYQQSETKRRLTGNCSAGAVAVNDATFAVGLSRCYSVKEEFLIFAEYFNCARVVGGDVPPETCDTLLAPISDWDGFPALIFGSMILLTCVSLPMNLVGECCGDE